MMHDGSEFYSDAKCVIFIVDHFTAIQHFRDSLKLITNAHKLLYKGT